MLSQLSFFDLKRGESEMNFNNLSGTDSIYIRIVYICVFTRQ